jgi:hypothetical protein
MLAYVVDQHRIIVGQSVSDPFADELSRYELSEAPPVMRWVSGNQSTQELAPPIGIGLEALKECCLPSHMAFGAAPLK